MNPQQTGVAATDQGTGLLYRVGGLAAILSGVLLRRNLSAEISLLGGPEPPSDVAAWLELLADSRLLGLAYLDVGDIANYLLVGVMLVALYAALRERNRAAMMVATATGLVGIAVYFASNQAFSMLALSDQLAGATTQAEQAGILAAGQGVLAVHPFSSPAAHPGSGGYASLLLVAISGLIISVVMLRGDVFGKVTAWLGILAAGFDLAYCLAYAFVPAVDTEVLALVFLPAAGLFWTIWHILVGWRLWVLGRPSPSAAPERASA
jgi:hypothetical protein